MNPQFFDIFMGAIRHVPFSVGPDLLHRIQLRRIRRKTMNLESATLMKEVANNLASVGPSSIPKQYHRPAQMAQQTSQKSHHIRAFDVMSIKTGIQSQPPKSGRYGQGGNRRNFIPPVTVPDYWSFTCRRPCFTDVGDEQKPALIEERQMGAMSFGVFLYAAKHVFSNGRWLFHHVPVPAVQVFDNSTPNHSAVSSRLRHWCNEAHSGSRSGGQSASTSISRWCGRRPGRLPASAAANRLSPAPTASKAGPICHDSAIPCCHSFYAPGSIAQLNSTTLSVFLQLRGMRCLCEAELWPGACAFPTVPGFHVVSCSIL